MEDQLRVINLQMDLPAINTLIAAMTVYLKQWPGGDPEEQEAIRKMLLILNAAKFEFTYSDSEE